MLTAFFYQVELFPRLIHLGMKTTVEERVSFCTIVKVYLPHLEELSFVGTLLVAEMREEEDNAQKSA